MDDADRQRLAATFDGAAVAYDRARPGFPDVALDWVLPPGAHRVVDLGAGTGKLTASLVSRGLEVAAVDASPGMLDVLTRHLPGVHTVHARAEATGLPSGAADAVLAGSAFHWFDRPAADAEIARLLRPGGVVGLLWNRRDPASPLAAVVDEVLGPRRLTAPDDSADTVLDPALFGPTERHDVPHEQWLTPDGFAELIGSRSYVLALPADERADVLARIRAVAVEVAGSDGPFPLPYITLTLRAERR